MSEVVVKENEQKDLVLNEGQEFAFSKVLDFFRKSGLAMFSLCGYAGTGKSTTIQEIMREIQSSGDEIIMTATTNKAVAVINEMAKRWGLESVQAITVHKLLGIKLLRIFENNEMKEIFKPAGQSLLQRGLKVIIDEASMVDTELFDLLLEAADEHSLAILFVGDPAQLPPVNEIESRAFSETENVELTEVIRQANDNPMKRYLTQIRENLKLRKPTVGETELNENGEGISFYTDKEEFRKVVMRDFHKAHKDDTLKQVKALAWTNRIVKKVNAAIRKELYGEDAPMYVIGERLIANSPILEEYDGQKITVIQNTEEMEVVDIQPFKVEPNFSALWLSVISERGMKTGFVVLANEEEDQRYKDRLDKLAKSAKAEGERGAWVKYYRAREAIADVDYSYALTVHKSQGSTFEKVYVFENNILMNPRIVERNQCRYVAYSRASKNLYVLGKS